MVKIFEVEIDMGGAEKEIVRIKEDLNGVFVLAEEVEKNSYKSMMKAIHYAQIGWGIIQGLVRAAGGSISMTTRLAISAGLGAVKAFYPIMHTIFTAGVASVNAYQVGLALAGLAQLGTAVSALVAYESEQKDLSRQLRGLNFTMSNIGLAMSGMLIR